ncbi:endonuclease [Lysinibacillus yapensis]|uniref:Endonuclease n=1 Tax=Ureibacillus yapensis TaxID=2304605 RepID=A0A396SD82_9BACL|nr:endonuclease [Lysinibacillus yapensis]RHW39284.1 endonuclease [Lysinibacillus yapensis]
MHRIQMLLSQIECIDQIMTAKIENERTNIHGEMFSQLGTTYQKVSLAEKQFHVKNACSPIASVHSENLVQLKEDY